MCNKKSFDSKIYYLTYIDTSINIILIKLVVEKIVGMHV